MSISNIGLPSLPSYVELPSNSSTPSNASSSHISESASETEMSPTPITPGVVHFFTTPPSPKPAVPGQHIINVGASPCPAPCTPIDAQPTPQQSPTTTAAAGAGAGQNYNNEIPSSTILKFCSQPYPQHSNGSIQMVSPTTPPTPATGTTDYHSHDGVAPHPIVLTSSTPPTNTRTLQLPASSLRPRGLSGASYASAIANWKHSAGHGTLMSRTPSVASLLVSPIAMGLSKPNTPLLASTTTGETPVTVHVPPGTPPPQRMVTTSTAELIDLRVKHRFLLRLMKALHAYGCATHRTESLLRHACDALGLKGEFCVFPTLVIVSFGAPDGDPAKSITHTFPATGGLNCAKLGETDDLAQLVGQGGISLDEAEKRLDVIIAQKNPNPYLVFFSFGLCSASSAAIFFGGGWYDVAISFALGLLVGAFTLLADKYKGLSQLLEFTTSMFVSFFARVITSYVPDTCYFANLLSSLVWFFPGLSITLSVAEVSAQSLVSGSARFFYAVVTSLQIGFGMALGGGLASWDGNSPSNSCTKAKESGDWVTAIFFVCASFTFNVLLSASIKQWLPMSLVCAIGFAVNTVLASPLGDDTATMMAALSVGLSGSIYARVTGHQPVITTISGILMLVPGSLGVRGVSAFLSDDVVSGMLFGFNMLITGLSITIGLMISRMLVFPSKRFRNQDSYI